MNQQDKNSIIAYVVMFLCVIAFLCIEIFVNKPRKNEQIKQTVTEAVLKAEEETTLPEVPKSVDFENQFSEDLKNEVGVLSLMGENYQYKFFPINGDEVSKNSKLIWLEGTLDNIEIFVEASTEKKSAVYFYIDSGETGGLLGVKRNENKNQITDGKAIEFGTNYEERFENPLKLSNNPRGQIEVDLKEVLNDNKKHWTIAFVNNPTGILNKFDIHYECLGKCQLYVSDNPKITKD